MVVRGAGRGRLALLTLLRGSNFEHLGKFYAVGVSRALSVWLAMVWSIVARARRSSMGAGGSLPAAMSGRSRRSWILVWKTATPAAVKDVDVAFFDTADLTHDHELAAEDTLQRVLPEIEWDVKNQARVHLWFEGRFGVAAERLTSAVDGIAMWPETATAVAVRRRADDRIEIAAPHGLDDLLDGVWRRNPPRVTDTEARERLARKQPLVRWPGVSVIE